VHASGELVVVGDITRGVRERRARGTRGALDWKYSFRLYAFVPLILMFGAVGGIDLLAKDVWWQRVIGVTLVLATALVVGVLVRWLVRPVDPMSQERRTQYYEEMRFANLWREATASLAGWRARRRAP
jgi:hypothetical protein